MDILTLETEASKLRINLLKINSSRSKLFLLYSFFELILQYDSYNAVESYLLEFTSQYCDLISKVSFSGVEPATIHAVLTQIQRVNELSPEEYKDIIVNSFDVLQEKYDHILSVLNGNNETVPGKRMYLPLLEKGGISFEGDYGQLSTLSVQLRPKSDESKFHIIPGSGDPDTALKKQVNDSLINALRIAGDYTKVKHQYWDVYIDFENKSGEYSGSSFGMLLVLKFVEELLRYYDSPVKIFSNSSAAVTGSVDEKGNIAFLSNDIIIQKTKTVFYSDAEVFIIPENDLPEAREILNKLNIDYPERYLKLTGIQTIDDLFNLRNVVGLKRESALLRTAKFVKKQAVSAVLLLLLTVMIFYSGILDFDDNPDHFMYKGRNGIIENKNGKDLLKTILLFDYDTDYRKASVSYTGKILDINNDGTNEIILSTSFQFVQSSRIMTRGISCYDKHFNKIWHYSFTKQVSTLLDKHTDTYDIKMIDTLTLNNKLYLYCLAANSPNEVGAVFRVDVRNGSVSNDILWNSGHLEYGVIEDCNRDGQRELYITGLNNGFGRCILFSVDADKLKGQLPSLPDYKLLNIGNAETNQYLLLPKSDYTNYFGSRYNVLKPTQIHYDYQNNDFLLYLLEGNDPSNWVSIGYRFDSKLRLLSIVFSDALVLKRDALIKQGKISGPLTRTKEFKQSLISQLRYWDGTKFVTAGERFNSQ